MVLRLWRGERGGRREGGIYWRVIGGLFIYGLMGGGEGALMERVGTCLC